VEVATECVQQAECPNARWSSFYGTWVRRESRATAEQRYARIVDAAVTAANELLCVDESGRRVENCTPYTGVSVKLKNPPRWKRDELATMGAAFAIIESGLREDVQVGRGFAKKPSDDGGRGRGPGKEACLLQIHPKVYRRFTDGPLEALMGHEREALLECFRTGMRMIINARAVCSVRARGVPWDWATAAMYTTGHSCTAGNQGKTAARTYLYRRMLAAVRNASKKKHSS